MINFKILVQYEGTRYKGWQRQNNTDMTIQGKIEGILKKNYGRNIEIDGSGRTDGGVHALGQVANYRLHEYELTDGSVELTCKSLMKLFSDYLPEDIAVVAVREASDRFHSRLSAVKKTYIYRLWLEDYSSVTDRRFLTKIEQSLDVEAMKAAGAILLGEHDFKAFCGNPKMKKSTVREIYNIDIEEIAHNSNPWDSDGPLCGAGREIRITYTGSGFLQNMVRILTGTLVEVGKGQISPEYMHTILESKDRQLAGPTMPASGLTLKEVVY